MMTMDYDRFPAIYPNYLDSNKTIKMGRRISAKDGVPEPTCMDIHEALASMNIRHVVQPYKGYSRDAESRWDNLGRVLVDLQGAKDKGLLQIGVDGIYDLDNVPDLDMSDENESGNGGAGKKKLLKELAQVIKVLPGRQQRLDQKKRRLEEEKAKAAKAEKEAAAKTKTATSSGAGSGGNRKKKGKKKK
mmetsp:Transcript_34295/g.77122  ORF Transcript_34295/g.77122 Transcript_34295/m.77122 type:complete len:189 (+) Transcript_34295:529-1095(+)